LESRSLSAIPIWAVFGVARGLFTVANFRERAFHALR
jgi:hypothetical protein